MPDLILQDHSRAAIPLNNFLKNMVRPLAVEPFAVKAEVARHDFHQTQISSLKIVLTRNFERSKLAVNASFYTKFIARRKTISGRNKMRPNFQDAKNGQGFLPGRFLVAALLLPSAACTNAKEIPRQCFDDAGNRFDLPRPDILRALAQQESSGACIARHPVNSNGTYDIGCMGINSSWLPMLHRQFGITEQDLLEPCTNIHVGAWIFAKNVRRFGDTWQAVGAYNAASESKRMEYAWKIYRQLNAAR